MLRYPDVNGKTKARKVGGESVAEAPFIRLKIDILYKPRS